MIIPNFSTPKALLLLSHLRIFFLFLLMWLRVEGFGGMRGCGLLIDRTSAFLSLTLLSFPKYPSLCFRKERSDWNWLVFLIYILADTGWLSWMPLYYLPLTSVEPGVSIDGGLDTLCLNIKSYISIQQSVKYIYIRLMIYLQNDLQDQVKI